MDLGTGDGMLVARIKGAVAAEEARKTGQRMRRKKQELAERGLPSGGGRRAFGWERDGLTIRESEAVLIREAAEVVLRGGSLRGIAADWETRGVETVAGGPWRPNSVKAVLRNPRNAGLRQHGREVIGTTKAGRPAFGRPIIVGEASWPPIIEREIWERLQLLFENPERSTVKVQTRSYPLRGVLECGVCGRKLTSVPRKKPIPSDPDRRMRYYGCRSDQVGAAKSSSMPNMPSRSWMASSSGSLATRVPRRSPWPARRTTRPRWPSCSSKTPRTTSGSLSWRTHLPLATSAGRDCSETLDPSGNKWLSERVGLLAFRGFRCCTHLPGMWTSTGTSSPLTSVGRSSSHF